MKMSMFRDICTDTLTNWQAVDTLRATNIQLLIDAQPDPYEALRKQRAATKNKFGSRMPPFNPQEIQKREMLRDRQINPSKWRTLDHDYLMDKQSVDKRRRDRYLQHFTEKEEEQKRMAEAAAKAAAMA